MKKYLAAFALAAVLAQPASAITFPSLTTIYVGSGAVNFSGQSVTVLYCSNVSGVTASVRFLLLEYTGFFFGSHTASLPHGATYAVATEPTDSLFEHFTFSTGNALGAGVVNIESTNSAVFCTAKVVEPDVDGANGFGLPLVRVNPHPGTVE
jgi:hypothetical protein